MKLIIFTSFLFLATLNGSVKQLSLDGLYNLKEIVLMQDSSQHPVGYQITGNLEVHQVHSKLLLLKVSQLKLEIMSRKAPTPLGFFPHTSNLDLTLNNPFVVNLGNGTVSHLYADSKETVYLINFKRGLGSLFQFQTEESETYETDSSGKCAVSYTRYAENIQKVKSKCEMESQLSSNENGLWGAKLETELQTLIQLSSDYSNLESIIAKESHVLTGNIAEFAKTRVSSQIELTLKKVGVVEQQYRGDEESVIDQIGRESGIQYKKFKLPPEREMKTEESRPPISRVVEENKKNLQSKEIGTSRSALAFIKVLQAVQEATTEELFDVINLKGNKKILPQLIDTLGNSNTLAAHQAALKKLKINADYDLDLCERYFWALSMSPKPNEDIIKDLMQIINNQHKDPKLWQTLVLTLSSMVKHITKKNNENNKILEEVTKMMTRKLQECESDDESCRQLYLKAFANIASPNALPVLLNFAVNSTRKSSVAAMNAISKLGEKNWNKEVMKVAENIFLMNGEYDSSARTISLDILLESKPSEQLMARLASVLKYKEAPTELKEYFLQQLNMISERCQGFNELVKSVLKSENLYHYNTLAQGGLSTAFSRTFMDGGSLSTTQEISNGILKRGNVHMNLHFNNITHTVFTLGIFSKGLNSFISDDGDEEQETPSAGLELTVLDVGLRPFVFFNGNSELMGHVWSGTGSTKTPAYQALIQLGQQEFSLPLGIGFFAEVTIFSAASVDLSGQIEVSLWNRNAKSLVQNSAGIIIQSTVRIDSSLIRTQVQSNLMVEPKLDLLSNIQFSDGFALCLQLQQPDISMRYNTFKVERIPGSKHKIRKARYKTVPVPGKTYALNMKNNEMCNIINKDS